MTDKSDPGDQITTRWYNAAAILLAFIYTLQSKPQRDDVKANDDNSADDRLARYTGRLTIATSVVAVAAVLSFFAALLQWWVLSGQLDITKRALVAVERPIILVTMPVKVTLEGGPIHFDIKLSNIGKQLATINGVTAFFVLQKDTDPPAPFQQVTDSRAACQPRTSDGGPMIGETIISPGDSIAVWCERETGETISEIQSIRDLTRFAFFRVIVICGDPIGFTRNLDVAFLITPSGRLIRAFDAQNTLEFSQTGQWVIQRALFGTLLKSEVEYERTRREKGAQ